MKNKVDNDMENEDRISELPKNLIESILEKVSSRDGARTSILSTKWRYIWSSLTKLSFDEQFFLGLKSNQKENMDEFCRIIDKILIVHNGPIHEFSLHIPFHQNPDIGHWILLLSRNGIKKLTLSMADLNSYNLPTYIYSCDQLTYLNISNCVVNPPLAFNGFCYLSKLYLKKVSFSTNTESVIYTLPALEDLSLRSCTDVQNVKIIAPKLYWFVVVNSHEFQWECFQNKTGLRVLYIALQKEVLNVVKYFNLVTLLAHLPKLSTLWLDGFSLKFLASSSLLESLLDNALVEIQLFNIRYDDLDQVLCTLFLLSNSPNLKDLRITASTVTNNQAEQDILDYMNSTGNLGMILNRLKTVVLKNFSGLDAELLLVKLLLLHSSSLEQIVINSTCQIAATKEKEISRKLMRFHRASPIAEIVYE